MADVAGTGTGAQECAGVEERVRSEKVGYLARQPILDRRGTVFAYALHFHGALEGPQEATSSGLSPASRGILDSLALYGVERFTGGAWGFVRCAPEALAESFFEGLPPTLTVLEIPRCADLSDKLVRECVRLKEMGFRLALSNYEPGDGRELLLPLVHFVKVGIRTIDSPEWSRLCNQLCRTSAFLVADEIHHHEAYRRARAAGLQYFQGFYFCNPELFPNGTVPADRAQHLEILRELFKDPLNLRTLCPLVSRDPSLVYRVLRFVNSPMCAVRNPVTSVETAIVILGDTIFRRIATLAIECTLTQNQPPELLRMTQIRARFCAQAAGLCGLNREEMYLLGLLSLLPAMLQVPMATILPNLPLRAEICRALAGDAVKERCLLSWLESLETNDIAECEALSAKYGLEKNKLAQLYLDAVEDVGNEAVGMSECRS